MNTAETYTGLITSEHQKPDLTSVVGGNAQPYVEIQTATDALGDGSFDLDSAVGPQLDAVGVRIGLSRNIEIPLPELYFTWGDTARGWNRGIWYNSRYGTEYGITTLGDGTYRQLLRAKILANLWDGTIPTAQTILDAIFANTGTNAFIQDDSTSGGVNVYFTWGDATAGWNQGRWFETGDAAPATPNANIGMTICVSGMLPQLALLFLLEQNIIPLKPVGVPVRYAFTSVNGAPLFGWGVQNEYLSGWGTGAWGTNADTILNASPVTIYPTG